MGSCCGGWAGGLIGGWLGLLVFLVAILGLGIATVVVTASSQRGGAQAAKRGDREPLDILAERYARGEIDREEFEERRQTIRATSRSPLRRRT